MYTDLNVKLLIIKLHLKLKEKTSKFSKKNLLNIFDCGYII